MTQRIFDIENEKDMQDLWHILPDNIVCIYTEQIECFDRPRTMVEYLDTQKDFFPGFININWHDKTEIRRPVQEATFDDVGKLCIFWEEKEINSFGILEEITSLNNELRFWKNNVSYKHCRRLTKQEIEELC